MSCAASAAVAKSRWRSPLRRSRSDLDLRTHLDDEQRRNAEIGSRTLGIALNERKKRFTPARHMTLTSGRDDCLPPDVIGEFVEPQVRTELALPDGKRDRIGHVRTLRKPVMHNDARHPINKVDEFDALLL